jgi:hypothetical protein
MIVVFSLLLIVHMEALKLRKSHANCAQNARQFELPPKKSVYKFRLSGNTAAGALRRPPLQPHRALWLQKQYSFTLIPSCIDAPC